MLALFLITVPLSVLGALMTWLISYDELRRHYAGQRAPAAEATRRAFTVLLFFLALWALVALVLGGGHS